MSEPLPEYTRSDLVDRAAATVSPNGAVSKQKRMKVGRNDGMFAHNLFNVWYKLALSYHEECPPYGRDWGKRDAFLSNIWRQEPYWAGVIRQVAAIDANRGWELIGGKRQVNTFKTVMHTHILAPDLIGHYEGMEAGSLAFHTSEIGCIKELARDGEDGPVRGFWHVPPSIARLTDDMEYPLSVDGQRWKYGDYFRVTTLANVGAGNPGYGFCSTAAMLEMMKIMVAVVSHKQEKLAARLPKGFLLGSGITQEQFDDAMNARKAGLDAQGRDVFGGLAVLLSSGLVDLKLLSLSQLPDGFDEKMFVEMYMYLSALTVGYDPAEFWPVSKGGIGRSEEAQAQWEKATGKGEKTFILRYFERLREVFPKTLDIVPEERNDRGELTAQDIRKAKKDVIMGMYDKGQGIVTYEEARSLAAEDDLIPRDWTIVEEEATATDIEQARINRWREVARSSGRVQDGARLFNNEPVVMYRYPTDKTITLFDSGMAMLRPHSWPVARAIKPRQKGLLPKRRATLYEQDGVVVTDEDVGLMLDQTEELIDEGELSQDVLGLLEAETDER